MNLTPGLHYSTEVDGPADRACVNVQDLADALPHGSGIDSDWRIVVKKNGAVYVFGSYHQMDENGMYNGWVDFTVIIREIKSDVLHNLRGPCEGQVQAYPCKGDITMTLHGGGREADYLYEMIDCTLQDARILHTRSEVR